MRFSPYQKIVLIGFRGAGKSTLAKALAEALQWDYISLDQEIEQAVGMPISRIVEQYGWEFFRKKETEMVQKYAGKQNVIIDCGGGIIENPHNMKLLTPGSFVVWVDARLEDIHTRLRQAGDRPLLNQSNPEADVEINYQRREPLYRQYAHLRVNTSVETPAQIVRRILQEIHRTRDLQ